MYPILVWYKKNGAWRRRWGGGWQTVTIVSAILVPGSNPHPDTIFFANFHVTAILAIST